MRALVEKLRAGVDLAPGDVGYAVAALLSPSIPDADKAEFLTALHDKGETAEEIAGFVRLLMERAVDTTIEPANLPGPMLDVCGTGGDGFDLFNVSTTVMFVLAAGGAVVVKHGNRSVTSLCGSADVLEALGVRIALEPPDLKRCVEEIGLGFVFARQYHPAFRALSEMRARLAEQKKRTIFNLLGPLLNPARPARQLVGVFAPRLTTVFAEVMRQLGRERAWAVHGMTETGAGIDDFSISGPTTVAEVADNAVQSRVLDAESFGIPRRPIAELVGDVAEANSATLLAILSSELHGPKRDLVLVNSAAGFVVAGIAPDMPEGIERARAEIDSGRALAKLRALQNFN